MGTAHQKNCQPRFNGAGQGDSQDSRHLSGGRRTPGRHGLEQIAAATTAAVDRGIQPILYSRDLVSLMAAASPPDGLVSTSSGQARA